jgi:hypothetical protein
LVFLLGIIGEGKRFLIPKKFLAFMDSDVAWRVAGAGVLLAGAYASSVQLDSPGVQGGLEVALGAGPAAVGLLTVGGLAAYELSQTEAPKDYTWRDHLGVSAILGGFVGSAPMALVTVLGYATAPLW